MKLHIKLSILLLPGFALQGCNHHDADKRQDANSDTIPVKVIALEGEHSAAPISVSGRFTTDNEVFLSFKTGGIVKEILVNEGEAIHEGQLLATLNMTEINAQVQQARLALEKARRDHERAMNLYKDSVATLEQLQNSQTALELARQQMDAARFNQKYSEIHAPQDGYVLRKMLNQGQLAGPGVPVLQTNGVGHGKWLLRVGVSDRDWERISEGDSASVEMTWKTSKNFPARVIRKSQGADPLSGAITVDLQLKTDKDPDIASGMFGKATIYPSANNPQNGNKVWAVPYAAVLDGDGSSAYVFVTNDGRRAYKQKVTIYGVEKDKVLISSGLEDSKELIISGSAYLTDSSIIHIIQ